MTAVAFTAYAAESNTTAATDSAPADTKAESTTDTAAETAKETAAETKAETEAATEAATETEAATDTDAATAACYGDVDYVPYYYAGLGAAPSDIMFNVIASGGQIYVVYG
jgi:hypothetical protein